MGAVVTIWGTVGKPSDLKGNETVDGLGLVGGETAVLVWSGLGAGFRWDLKREGIGSAGLTVVERE